MNKQVTKTLASLTLFTMLGVPVLYGQSGMLVANIPFDFNVGKASLPSGEYNVKPMSQGSIVIQSKDGRQSAIALTNVTDSPKSLAVGKLVFNRYGDQYFLSKVLTPGGTGSGKELIRTQNERELARNISKPETTIVAAKTR
jgi:hypothetical protein